MAEVETKYARPGEERQCRPFCSAAHEANSQGCADASKQQSTNAPILASVQLVGRFDCIIDGAPLNIDEGVSSVDNVPQQSYSSGHWEGDGVEFLAVYQEAAFGLFRTIVCATARYPPL